MDKAPFILSKWLDVSDGRGKDLRTLLGQKSGIKIPGWVRNGEEEEQCSKLYESTTWKKRHVTNILLPRASFTQSWIGPVLPCGKTMFEKPTNLERVKNTFCKSPFSINLQSFKKAAKNIFIKFLAESNQS